MFTTELFAELYKTKMNYKMSDFQCSEFMLVQGGGIILCGLSYGNNVLRRYDAVINLFANVHFVGCYENKWFSKSCI